MTPRLPRTPGPSHPAPRPHASRLLACSLARIAACLVPLLPIPASAQILRLGPFDIVSSIQTEIAYDSNIDDVYPEEEIDGIQPGDFYAMGKINASTRASLRPNTTLVLSGGFGYQKYLEREDSDIPLYDAIATLSVTLPPMFTLDANASAVFTSEALDQPGEKRDNVYYPGGKRRDPKLTVSCDSAINWKWRQLRAEGHVSWVREAYDHEDSKLGDNDETTYSAAAYWDVFSWGSIYYSYEHVFTTHPHSSEGENPTPDETEITKNFGLSGSIPLSWIPHPQLTYSIGIESEDSNTSAEKDATWEPSHTLSAQDSFPITPSLLFSGSLTWERAIYDDEITLTYSLSLRHSWGKHIVQDLQFDQEPSKTFGSNQDTKTTTYSYSLGISDFFLRGVSTGFSARYEISEPLEDENPTIEYTTNFSAHIGHSKSFSPRLSRTLNYTYTWECSNLHIDGAQEKHLISYGLNYVF